MKLGNNISQVRAYNDSTWFRATCGCMDSQHDRTIVVENDDGIISCTIYAEFKYYDWEHGHSNIFKKAWSRIKAAARVLFTGYMKFDGEFMFHDEGAARDYANSILDAIDGHKVPAVQANSGTN